MKKKIIPPKTFSELIATHFNNRFFKKKVLVIIATLIVGLLATIKTAVDNDFSADSIQDWLLNGVLAGVILGFVVQKYLSDKGKLD